MTKTGVAAACLVVALVLGCGRDPRAVVIPNEPAKWDSELSPSVQQLPTDEKELLGEYLARVKVGEAFGGAGIPPGMTVGEAITRQREFKAVSDLNGRGPGQG